MKLAAALAASALIGMTAAAVPAKAGLVQNGNFTNLTNGLGKLGQVTNAVGWTDAKWNSSTYAYNLVFQNATTGASNGSGTVALWTAANGGANTWNGLTASGVGNLLALDGDYDTGTVSQTINGLVVGNTYDLTFNYAFGQQTGFSGVTEQYLTASIGSDSFVTPTYTVANHGFTGWQSADYKFTATSTSEVLSFLATGNLPVPPFALVSDVAIAEPATAAMLVIGFAGLLGGAAVYHRRKQAGARLG